MKKIFRKVQKKEKGQGLTEYSVLITGVFVLVISVLLVTGEGARDTFCAIADTLNYPACAELSPDWGQPEAPAEEEEECVTHEMTQGGSQCDHSEDCEVLPGANNGNWDSGGETIDNFIIKAGQEYHIYQSGITYDGCYEVDLDGPFVTWEKIGSGPQCKNISHMESWYVPLCNEQ